MDDRPVESEDVEGLQPEVLGVQQGGQEGLHPLRAEVEIYPAFSVAPIIDNRAFPCMEANYPYAIKNQRGAS